MPDILPGDLELRSPRDLRTGKLAAFADTLLGLAAGSALCAMINHPPFGGRSANPSVWILVPVAVGARHGEAAGALAGLAAWAMHAGVATSGRIPALDGPLGAVSAFLFMLSGATAGYLSGAIRKIAREELAKHRIARTAIHRANITLRMAARVRDDLIQELFRARSGGSAVAAMLRRVVVANPERHRDELLEYLENVHEVKSAAVYRLAAHDDWRLVTSRGAHPEGAYPEKLLRGLLMARTVYFSEEPVFAESPHDETELPLLISPLLADVDGIREIVVVEDVTAERITPRETLGIATAIEFFGLALPRADLADHERFALLADTLLRMRRVCGVESALAVFSDSPEGEAACASLLKRIPGSVSGRWTAAHDAPAILIPGEHHRRLAPMFEEIRVAFPRSITLTAGFHEATDEILSADEWVHGLLSADHWQI